MPIDGSLSFLLNVCLSYIVSQSQTKISDTLRDTILKLILFLSRKSQLILVWQVLLVIVSIMKIQPSDSLFCSIFIKYLNIKKI